MPGLERLAGAIERGLRSGDGAGRDLDLGRGACQRLPVDVGEANVGQRRGEEVEQGLDGGGDGAHGLNILSVDAERQELCGRPAPLSPPAARDVQQTPAGPGQLSPAVGLALTRSLAHDDLVPERGELGRRPAAGREIPQRVFA